MPARWQRLLERVKQPDYVGSNRCIPCTVVNSLIAAALALLVSLRSLLGSAAVFGLSLLLIYYRGYLIPGTPTLTQQYLPARVLRWFGKQPAAPASGELSVDTQQATGHSPRSPDTTAERLLDAGVIEPCSDEDDLCLASSFREQWWRRIEQCRDDETAQNRLAASIAVDPAALSLEDADKFYVSYEGERIGRWLSRGAFLADIAAEPTLNEWLSDWEGLSDRERTELLVRIRVLLEDCPGCGQSLEQNVEMVSTCCGGDLTQVAIDCKHCGSVFAGTEA